VSPSRRDREYAKRRYQKWLVKQSEKMARQRLWKRIGAGLAAGVTVLALAVATFIWLGPDDSVSEASKTLQDNPCPVPTATPPATPPSWENAPSAELAGAASWQLTLNTSCGDITADLDGAAAPQAVSSTIFLAQNGFYDGTVCHRLTTEGIYVLQCGDPLGTGAGGPGYSYGPVENAPADDVYPAGTIAMARQSNDGNTMGSQFFIVYQDSTIPSDAVGGYTVLGQITQGLDIVQTVADGGVVSTTGEAATDGAPVRAISLESTAVAKE
jgi:peptidyl-prolyl cis-trans isomerase B (cyclophilin B)